MRWTVMRTGDGWQIGYVDQGGAFNTTAGDPVYATKAEAQAALNAMLEDDRRTIEAERTYQTLCAHACGYRD